MNGRPWTEAEVYYVLDTPHLTAAEVGRELGRTAKAVERRRTRLLGREDIRRFAVPGMPKGHYEPWKVAKRPLVARTCIRCGLLLDASWFLRLSGYWTQSCRECGWTGKRRHGGEAEKDRARSAKLQQLSAERATRTGHEWTDADVAVLMDPNLSLFGMALKTGRTFHGIRRARARFGLGDRAQTPLGDPSEAQWIIRFSEEVAA